MDPTSISELERQEQEAIAALREEFPAVELLTPGCDQRYAVRLWIWEDLVGFVWSQWWEYDTLSAVRQRIVWALAHR